MIEIVAEIGAEIGAEIVAGASLVVRVGPYPAEAIATDVAGIAVGVADPDRGRALMAAIARAVADALRSLAAATAPVERAPVVILRSRKRLARDADRLAGAIAIVPVTARNARHLVALIDGLRAAGAIGIQLAWDGADPARVDTRAKIERHVFAALEHARATPNQPPVVLSANDRPVTALHLLVAHRSPSTPKDDPR